MNALDKVAISNAVARSVMKDIEWLRTLLDDSPHNIDEVHSNLLENLTRMHDAVGALRHLTERD